jgi:protoporphyrinogen oxidase
MNSKNEIVILGSGISGLSVGYHLKKNGIKSVVYEKDKAPGGLCKSQKFGKFIFDQGVHISFTRDPYVKRLFSESAGGRFGEKQLSCMNYWHGYWLKHLPQNNLHSLRKEIIQRCLIDFIRAYFEKKVKAANFQDWGRNNFGKFFFDNFTAEYTRKFWTVEPEHMTTEWTAQRIAIPDLKKIVNGALGAQKNDGGHYISMFRYPEQGGYASFLRKLTEGIDVRLKTFPIAIDVQQKEITLNTGEVRAYQSLVSTIPLPELVKIIKNAPKAVIHAARDLKWTSLFMLNFYTKQSIGNPSHFNYYYDKEIPYTRICYMSRLGKRNAPPGFLSLQAEIPYSESKPLPCQGQALIRLVKRYIEKTENIKADRLIYLGKIDIKYGYVIFDKRRAKSLGIIKKFLNDKGILSCGRFGEWDYLWSDQAFLSGKNAAGALLSIGI